MEATRQAKRELLRLAHEWGLASGDGLRLIIDAHGQVHIAAGPPGPGDVVLRDDDDASPLVVSVVDQAAAVGSRHYRAAWAFAPTSPPTMAHFVVHTIEARYVLRYLICALWVIGAAPAAVAMLNGKELAARRELGGTDPAIYRSTI